MEKSKRALKKEEDISKVLKPVLIIKEKNTQNNLKEEIMEEKKQEKTKDTLENEVEEEDFKEFASFMNFENSSERGEIARRRLVPNLSTQTRREVGGDNVTIRDVEEEKNDSGLSYRPSDLANNTENNSNYESVRAVSGARITPVSSIDVQINQNPNLGIKNLIPTSADQADKYQKAGDDYSTVNIGSDEDSENERRRRRRNF